MKSHVTLKLIYLETFFLLEQFETEFRVINDDDSFGELF